ncbi:hypothetical protein KW787_04150 [Candidatus Pacearchaeota archaeon]|nr:hypothetical protein [Candidatus Pacearchaeota archaeon]
MIKKFFHVLYSSLQDLVKSPIIVVLSLLLFAAFSFLSFVSTKIILAQGNSSNVIFWIVGFALIVLYIGSFFLSLMIGISRDIVERRKRKLSYFSYTSKNFIVILFVLLLGRILYAISNAVAVLAIPLLHEYSIGVLFLLIAVSLLGVLIFFTFSSFYLVIKDTSLKGAFRQSMSFVKRNYLSVLSLLIIFFIIYAILNEAIAAKSTLAAEIIHWLIVFPYFILVLTRFVVKNDLRTK